MRSQLRSHFKYMRTVLKKSQNKIYSPVKIFQKVTNKINVTCTVEEKVRYIF
jgi:hypothetical protein